MSLAKTPPMVAILKAVTAAFKQAQGLYPTVPQESLLPQSPSHLSFPPLDEFKACFEDLLWIQYKPGVW